MRLKSNYLVIGLYTLIAISMVNAEEHRTAVSSSDSRSQVSSINNTNIPSIQQNLIDGFSLIAKITPSVPFLLRFGLNEKLGFKKTTVSIEELVFALKNPNIWNRLSTDEIARLASALDRIQKDSSTVRQIKKNYSQVAIREPQSRFILLNGLHKKLGLTNENVSARDLFRAISQMEDLSNLESSEITRLAKAALPLHFQDQSRSEIPNPNSPSTGSKDIPAFGTKGTQDSETFVLDRRLRAGQQRYQDCWAFAFGVTLQLALLGHPQTQSNTPAISKAIWDKARSITPTLSRMTRGNGCPTVGSVINYANSMGWSKAVTMRVIHGEGRSTVGSLLKNILFGMQSGVRFSGYFNSAHAMAIVGVDLKSNSIIVTDSSQNGRLIKIRVDGPSNLDGMVAIVRNDLAEGVDWINRFGQTR